MAPIKLEKYIKDTLRARRIRPSTAAWDRISENLETPQKQRKTLFLSYGIAAGFIGLLLVSVLFFKSENVPAIKSENAITDSNKEDSPPVAQKMKQWQQHRQLRKNEVVARAKADIAEKGMRIKTPTIEEGLMVRFENKTTADTKVEEIMDDPETVIEHQLAQVIAQANSMEAGSDLLTDAEVDSLLRQAQREILAHNLFRNDNTVDAMALLSEVEGEIDRSFRNRIFERLKTGFLKVRTAVADRNN